MHLGERKSVARRCMRAVELEALDTLVDDVTDDVARDYSAWPDRLFLIDRTGVVVYQGLPGPWGFDPSELEAAILSELGP